MSLPVTALTVSVLAVLLFVLSIRVIKSRRSEQVSLGDAGNEILQRRIRGQANLTEYGPFGIFLILVAELQSANLIILSVVAAAFVLGRLLHGYAFGFTEKSMRLRVRGMQFTLLSMLALVALNLWAAAASLYA